MGKGIVLNGAKLEAVEGWMQSFLCRNSKGGANSSFMLFLSSKFICSLPCYVVHFILNILCVVQGL